MSVQLAPNPIFQAFGPNGQFLVGGKVFTFAAGTTTPQASYVDSTQTTQNTNPIILNSLGQASVWLDVTLKYKIVVQDANGNPLYTQDNISGQLTTNSLIIGPPASGTALTVNNAITFDAIDINITQSLGSGWGTQMTGNFDGPLRCINLTNNSQGTHSENFGIVIGSGSFDTFIMGKTGPNFAGSLATGTPAGEICFFQAGGNIPISFIQGGHGLGTQQVLGINATGALSITPNPSNLATGLTVSSSTGVGQSVATFNSLGGTGPAVTINIQPGAVGPYLSAFNGSIAVSAAITGTGAQIVTVGAGGATPTFGIGANNATDLLIAANHTITMTNALGIFGNAPPAQSTGWGTPTGAATIINYPGATATLVQTSNVVAQLITQLKAFGLLGA